MGLIDTILGALAGKSSSAQGVNPLIDALGALITQNGGIDGLMAKFSQGGHGDTFASWVGMDENKSISPDQIKQVLGSDQLQMLAAKLGVDSGEASHFLAEHLPKVVDKLTPTGQVEPGMDPMKGLAEMLPALLQSFAGSRG